MPSDISILVWGERKGEQEIHVRWLAKPTGLLLGGEINSGHRVPGTLLGFLQDRLEVRVGKEYGCTFMGHPTLFLSVVDLLHGLSLYQQMVAFTAEYAVF